MSYLLSLLVVLMAVTAAPAQEDARQILAKAKDALGGAAWDGVTSIHTKANVRTSGLAGPVESWEDVRTGRYYSTFMLGAFTGAQGFDGKTVWSQDSSRQVRADEGGDAREGAVNEAYRRTMAYWFPQRWEGRIESPEEKREGDRKFYVIKITPRGGRPFEIWIDAGTYLFDRTVEKTALETRTTFFSDYREVSGVKIPFSSRSTNGEERYDQLLAADRVELDVPLKDAMFRMPPPPEPDFVFAGGKVSTTIPFELINNHIYVQVGLNGKGPFRFLCDTGGSNILTPDAVKTLGLKSEGALQGRGVGEKSEDFGLTKIGHLEMGGVTLSDQVFAVFDPAALAEVEGLLIQGLVGYEVFKRFVVEVDYENSRLTLTLPSAFSYEGKGTVVPFKFNGQIPQVDGEIDGVPGKFDIDTGSRSSLTILAPFAEKNNLKARWRPKVEAVTGWGVGGPARGLVGRAVLVKLGNVAVENPLTEISVQTKGAFTDPYVAGNVGGGLLKRFNIIFDYDRHQLIFERNANFSLPDDYDRAGIWLNLVGGVFKVMNVVAGGPAAEAGLKEGDSILAIDGKTPAVLSLAAARTMFKSSPPGTKVKLLVSSGGKKEELTITLRDLI